MMKKCLICLSCIWLLACSSVKTIQPEACANALAELDVFDDELSLQSEKMAKKILKINDEVDEIYLYVGTGALAERIVVIKADESVINTIKEQIENERESLIKSYADYNPNEVGKLEDAVILVEKDILVYCVSKDSEQVQKIIENNRK